MFFLPFKNMLANRWRSFNFGIFILITSLFVISFQSFISTIERNMENALVYALTGDIQIRPALTPENDMFSEAWNGLPVFNEQDIQGIEEVLARVSGDKDSIKLMRTALLLGKDEQMDSSLVVALDPASAYYSKSLNVLSGRALDPVNTQEIVLSEKIGKKLGVVPGDSVEVKKKTNKGFETIKSLTVAGIAEINLLSKFGLDVSYMDIQTTRELAGHQAGEITDIIVYTKDRSVATNFKQDIESEMPSSPGYKVTSWDSMGGFAMGIVGIYSYVFIGFLVALFFIIAILIMNLIFMMGLERRQEIGTLKAIGFSKWRIVWLFLSEILMVSFIFSIIGFAIGSALVIYLSSLTLSLGSPWDYVLGTSFRLQFDPSLIVPELLSLFAFTAVAALYPSIKAAGLNPIDALKDS